MKRGLTAGSGMVLGLIIGAVYDHVALGMVLGLLFGAAAASARRRRSQLMHDRSRLGEWPKPTTKQPMRAWLWFVTLVSLILGPIRAYQALSVGNYLMAGVFSVVVVGFAAHALWRMRSRKPRGKRRKRRRRKT